MATPYDSRATMILAQLREAVGLTQDEVGEYFGLVGKRRRDSISSWESGKDRPARSRRSRFISYLWEKLGLQYNQSQFEEVWSSVVEKQWGWLPLREDELPAGFIKKGNKRRIPFLAPPRPPYSLIGRQVQLEDLKNRLIHGKTTALSALNGLPGVGKTAIAVELANDPEILAHFKDGVLWAGLGRKADVMALLGMWGLALGIPAEEMDSLTSKKKRAFAVQQKIGLSSMLLVIDDAWQLEDALAFHIGGPNCAHLLTTRITSLATDFAEDGTISASELSLDEGLEMLEQFIGKVAEVEPNEARELIDETGGLPLAIFLMAKYLRREAYKGERPLRRALERLRDAEKRLSLEEPQVLVASHPSLPEGVPLSLRAIIKISEEALNQSAKEAFIGLSVFSPKPDTFSREAALVVCNESIEAINSLLYYGLIEQSEPGRYMMHQVIVFWFNVKWTPGLRKERISQLRSHLNFLPK